MTRSSLAYLNAIQPHTLYENLAHSRFTARDAHLAIATPSLLVSLGHGVWPERRYNFINGDTDAPCSKMEAATLASVNVIN